LKKKEFYKIQEYSKKIRVFQNPYGRPGDRAKIREKPGKYGRMDSLCNEIHSSDGEKERFSAINSS
jgi:hypothetical protein